MAPTTQQILERDLAFYREQISYYERKMTRDRAQFPNAAKTTVPLYMAYKDAYAGAVQILEDALNDSGVRAS